MKDVFLILVIILSCVATIFPQSERQEILNTVAGEIKIDSAGLSPSRNSSAKSSIYLNGKIIHSIDGSKKYNYSFATDLYGYLKGVNSNWIYDLVILHESKDGNDCGGYFRVIELQDGGKFKVFQEIGNCSEEPIITWSPNNVTIKFPYVSKINSAQTWVNQSGILKQLQEEPKKK